MTREAMAAYYYHLRTLQKISRATVAEMAQTSEQTIYRIELENQEPRSQTWAFINRAVGGDFRLAAELLSDPTADKSSGKIAAENQINPVAEADQQWQADQAARRAEQQAWQQATQQREIRQLRQRLDALTKAVEELEAKYSV